MSGITDGRGYRRAQRGQVAPLFALSLLALLAVVALAVDLGNSYLDRRAMQASSDAAASAGVSMLITNQRSPGTYSDAEISTVVADIASKAQAGSNVEDSLVAQYTDSNGTVVGTVGGGTIPATAFGIKVAAANTHPTALMGLLGFKSTTETGTATSVYRVMQTVNTSSPNYFPYAVWYYNCAARRVVKPGDTVVFHSNSYVADAACSSPAWAGNSNNFKGYIRDRSMPATISQGDTLASKGGNAFGTADLTALHNAYVNNQVIIMAVMNSESGNGNMSLHVSGFVALKLSADYSSNPSGDWTATVVSTIPGSYFTNCSGTCPKTVSYDPVATGIYR